MSETHWHSDTHSAQEFGRKKMESWEWHRTVSGLRSCIYTWNAMNSTKVNIKDFIINHKHCLDQQEIFNKNYIFTNFNYWEYLTHVLWVSGQLLSAIVAGVTRWAGQAGQLGWPGQLVTWPHCHTPFTYTTLMSLIIMAMSKKVCMFAILMSRITPSMLMKQKIWKKRAKWNSFLLYP